MSEVEPSSVRRPGGRSARIRTLVHRAVTDLIDDNAEPLTVPLVAQRAGVAATTVYRRWGDIDTLRTEVALEVLSADADVPDTGDLRRDLHVWCEFLVTDITRPGKTALLRSLIGAMRDADRSRCLDKREDQIDTILRRATERGDDAPSHRTVMDHVVAPLYFRVVFGLGGTDAAFARSLVNDVLARQQSALSMGESTGR